MTPFSTPMRFAALQCAALLVAGAVYTRGAPTGHVAGLVYPDEAGAPAKTPAGPRMLEGDLGEGGIETYNYPRQREREEKVKGAMLSATWVDGQGTLKMGEKELLSWDYEPQGAKGPLYWGKFSTVCQEGRFQSPVDLGSQVSSRLEPSVPANRSHTSPRCSSRAPWGKSGRSDWGTKIRASC
jgi:hypothetical protein